MFIYVVTNSINGKQYVGQTIHPVSVRWSQHIHQAKKRASTDVFHRAIRKYGSENFTIETVYSASSMEDLNIKEIELIVSTNTHYLTGNGYNMCAGGKSRFGWKEDSVKTESRISKIRKPIVCVETQEIFSSIKEAAEKFMVSPGFLGSVLRGKKASVSGKFHFRYLNSSENEKPEQNRLEKKKRIEKLFPFGRPVVCVTNGAKYPSVKEAARKVGVAEVNMYKHLRKIRKTCKGLIFSYEDQLGE